MNWPAKLGHAEIAKAVDDQCPRLLLDTLRGTRTLLILPCEYQRGR
jgi:hypothetical protein